MWGKEIAKQNSTVSSIIKRHLFLQLAKREQLLS
jgi:hypothetical protein